MRNWVATTTLAVAALATIGMLSGVGASGGDGPAAKPGAPPAPKKLSWDVALKKLNAGNAHFVHDEPLPTDLSKAHRATELDHQDPYAIVLTCADSRVAPEHVFGAGLGELFVVRTAGNVVDPIVSGSIEYAVHHLHVHLIVVMGHANCGAVKAKIAPPEDPSEDLLDLVGHVHIGEVHDLSGWPQAISTNTVHQAEQLLENSVIEHAFEAGQKEADTDTSSTVHIYTGVYDLGSGEVKLVPLPAAVPAGHSGH